MTIPGSSIEADTAVLRNLLERAASIDMTVQAMEDELATRTGFDDAVRNWVSGTLMPNGLVRKIILSNAQLILNEGSNSGKSEGKLI